MKKQTILITGVAGFIGYHLTQKLCYYTKYNVIGIDNLNDYYDVQLKKDRLTKIKSHKNFTFFYLDLTNKNSLREIFENHSVNIIIHLAAQAGVRFSLDNPQAYIDSNITAMLNILELMKDYKLNKLIYASSSSVYGNNKKLPFAEKDITDTPKSMYAVTKKTNELMAYTYSDLYGINSIGLRFFTVYGPWGRPDMALYKFTKSIVDNKPIQVYNNGNHRRSFTYIDDIINSIDLLVDKIINDNFYTKCSIFNIGGSNPKNLMDYISCIEIELNKKAKIEFLPMQLGDIETTEADNHCLISETDYKPSINISDGISLFIKWYKEYYKV